MLLPTSSAHAAGVTGAGSAKASEWKSAPRSSTVRARAIRRARLAALKAAIDALETPVDAAAKKAVLRDGTRWTGAYRVLSERVDPEGIQIELEVEIDVARLAKFVAPAELPAPASVLYHVAEVTGAKGCDGEAEQIRTDLARLGVATEKVGNSAPVAVSVSCQPLGAVPNTLLQAVRLRVEAKADGRTLLRSDEAAFGVDEQTARARGASGIAEALADTVLADPGGLVMRVESPHPASRVRRLQRAMVDRVQGVRGASIAGIDPDGAVRLRLSGRASADKVARALQALSLPDFSITIIGIHDARGLTIRLDD